MDRDRFGHLEGHPVGSHFADRQELSKAGVHRPTQAGIAGSKYVGADSIVLSGGYEDDRDFGDEILYTGQGGRDPSTGAQVHDQELNRGNLALAKSAMKGLPVRVIRGHSAVSKFAPDEGYRYDGLYRVTGYWRECGTSGYYVWRYRLVRIESQSSHLIRETETDYDPPERAARRVVRVVRESEQADTIKDWYDHTCQVCGTRLEGTAGPYAEAAHIQPLGDPHRGPDILPNMLCLCPNHHVLLDYGAFSIADDHELLGAPGKLAMARTHELDRDCLTYHREHILGEVQTE